MVKKIPSAIGIDIGGTKMLLQTFDSQLNVLQQTKVKTNTKNHASFLKALYQLIDPFFTKSIKGIGVAVPGIVKIKKGTLVHAPHLPIKKNTPLRALLAKRYKVKVHVDNDINAFLVAEHARPALKKYRNLLAVMVGTGVGGAMMVDGKIVYGKDGFAGEVGHMIINQNGKRQTLEKNIGGYYLSGIPKRSLKIVKSLGIGLSNLNLIFNPEAIVLGGSVYHRFLSSHKKNLEKIIASHALDKNTPKLIDGKDLMSVPKGAVMLMRLRPA